MKLLIKMSRIEFSYELNNIHFRDIVREIAGFLTFICIMYVVTVGSRNPHSYRLKEQLQNSFINKPFCHEELFDSFKECQDVCNKCIPRRPVMKKVWVGNDTGLRRKKVSLSENFKWKDSVANHEGRWKSFHNMSTTDDFWDWTHSIIIPGTC